MYIQTLYTYPIKSLRGFEVSSSTLTKHGLPHDRRYILVKDNGLEVEQRYIPMFVSKFPEMCLFTTNMSGEEIEVTYNPPTNSPKTITIPLHPSHTTTPSTIDVDLHNSPVRALAMPDKYNQWFTSCFGYPVILAHLGSRYRQALGNLAPNAAERNPILRQQAEERQKSLSQTSSSTSSWTSRLTQLVTGTADASNGSTTNKDADHDRFNQPIQDEDYGITFADVAPYLLTTTVSLADVTSRISSTESNQEADMTKFRPNIVLGSSPDEVTPYEEDYWGEVLISPADQRSPPVKLLLNHNCTRCVSLNVDYATGKADGTNVLKLLQKDRRVDVGSKYSPVFGRYAWLVRGQEGEGQGFKVRVGDQVEITKRNEVRTEQRWPGLGGNPKEVLWPDV